MSCHVMSCHVMSCHVMSCMYVCMYVCMHQYIYKYTFTYSFGITWVSTHVNGCLGLPFSGPRPGCGSSSDLGGGFRHRSLDAMIGRTSGFTLSHYLYYRMCTYYRKYMIYIYIYTYMLHMCIHIYIYIYNIYIYIHIHMYTYSNTWHMHRRPFGLPGWDHRAGWWSTEGLGGTAARCRGCRGSGGESWGYASSLDGFC